MQERADTRRLTVQQRSQGVLLLREKNVMWQTQRRFCARFGRQWALSPKTLRRFHQQFEQYGTVLAKTRGLAVLALSKHVEQFCASAFRY